MKAAVWTRIRKILKYEFEQAGITSCELCGSTFALSFAHRVKRRFITTEDEMRVCALLCQECHNWTEYGTKDEPGTHERMKRIIDEIIERREL